MRPTNNLFLASIVTRQVSNVLVKVDPLSLPKTDDLCRYKMRRRECH